MRRLYNFNVICQRVKRNRFWDLNMKGMTYVSISQIYHSRGQQMHVSNTQNLEKEQDRNSHYSLRHSLVRITQNKLLYGLRYSQLSKRLLCLHQIYTSINIAFQKFSIRFIQELVSMSNVFALLQVPQARFFDLEQSFCLCQIKNENKRSLSDPVVFLDNATSDRCHSPSEVQFEELARIFELRVESVKLLFEKFPYIESKLRPTVSCREKVNVLKAFNIPLSVLEVCPRFLVTTTVSELKKRMTLLKEHDFLIEKSVLRTKRIPFLLECDNKRFAKALQILIENKLALEGYGDKLEYLQFRLRCSENIAKSMLNSYPLEREFSEVRLKKSLDFLLLEAGFSTDFVIRNRYVLVFSVEKLRWRLDKMRQAGISNERVIVSLWCLSKKEFQKWERKTRELEV